MPKQLDPLSVYRCLRTFYRENKSKITIVKFEKGFKPYLNQKEARRFFDVLAEKGYFTKDEGALYYNWAFDIRETSFSEDKVRNILLNNKIKSVYGPKPKEKKIVKKSSLDVSKLSDEKLLALSLNCQSELQSRKEKKDREALQMEFAQKLGCSVEQLATVVDKILDVL